MGILTTDGDRCRKTARKQKSALRTYAFGNRTRSNKHHKPSRPSACEFVVLLYVRTRSMSSLKLGPLMAAYSTVHAIQAPSECQK